MAKRKSRPRTGDAHKRHLIRNVAEQSALRALARRHPGEYAALLQAELDFLGYEPPATERPCACGRMIVRRSAFGPWPTQCETCNPRKARDRERAAASRVRQRTELLAKTRYDPSKMRAS